MTTVAAVIIGDEILSGKVVDTNTGSVIQALRSCGATLGRVAVIGDSPEQIGDEVRSCSERYDWVITSGGVGPTHDDRTIESIALAFGRRVVRPPQLEQAVREHFGDRINEAALKLAEVPDGTQLLEAGAFPLVLFQNIYILPGVPQIFEAKLTRICTSLGGAPPVVRRLYLQAHESAVADQLRAGEQAAAEVKIGSYPRFDSSDHNLMVTIEAPGPEAVDTAVAFLLERLPSELIVRID